MLAVVSQQDSWAIPVIEGMAAGRAVLTSEFNGSHEAIANGETGFVVEGAGDAWALAALLDGPLADLSVRAAIGSHAARAACRYDVEATHPPQTPCHCRRKWNKIVITLEFRDTSVLVSERRTMRNARDAQADSRSDSTGRSPGTHRVEAHQILYQRTSQRRFRVTP